MIPAAPPVEGGRPPVAITGMALRFPGASDVGGYWRNLLAGAESVRTLSAADLLAAGESPEAVSHPDYIPARGVVDGADCFDAAFFGLSDREALLTDPQQRLLLEMTWRALEDAGYPAGPEPRIGLFAGVRSNGFAELARRAGLVPPDRVSQLRVRTGSEPEFMATRVSYRFNLRGPSLTVQTACSSSLVAVHLACLSLAAGDCDIALAGGVSVQLPIGRGYRWEEGLIDSADGHCRAFDDAASGTVGGDGAGLVVLRLLDDALRDGDAIHAVILGTSVNNDGSDKLGFSAPSVHGQVALMRAGLRAAGIEPDSIAYVEAHGTGTRLGDPIELRALHEVFGGRRGKPCWVGSVKSNIGHLDSAAGVAGLIKAALAAEHGQIPASLHLHAPNRAFAWDRSPLRVARVTTPWPPGRPRRAAVSSLGMGGTNAFAIVAEPPQQERSPQRAAEAGWFALPVSAASPEALAVSAAALAAALGRAQCPDIRDAAHTLAVGRRPFPYRRAFVVRSAADGAAALRAAAPRPGEVGGSSEGGPVRRCVLLFPGQGVRVRGAGTQLYRSQQAFADALDEISELVRARDGWDPRPALCDADSPAGGDLEVSHAQVCLFAFQYSITMLATGHGITPDTVVGHSAGEVAAAAVAGVLSLPDAVALSVERGRACQRCPAGAMIAVAADAGTVAGLASAAGCVVSAVNALNQCTVSGTAEAIGRLARKLQADRVPHTALPAARAFHSPLMEPAAEALDDTLKDLDLRHPRIRFVSSATGSEAGEAVTAAGYWQRQLTQPVLFYAALAAAAGPATAYVDAGPGQVLRKLAAGHLRRSAEGGLAVGLHIPEPGRDEDEHLIRALAALWAAGAPVRWQRQHQGARRVRLPGHPLTPRRYPVPSPGPQGQAPPAEPPPAQAPPAQAPPAQAPASLPGPPPGPPGGPASASHADEAAALVAAIFEEVIGGPVPQPDESFFELGGDSLTAVQAVARITDAFGVELSISDFFSRPSPRQLADHLAGQRGGQGTS